MIWNRDYLRHVAISWVDGSAPTAWASPNRDEMPKIIRHDEEIRRANHFAVIAIFTPG
jgi:hypothetical protein